MMNVMDARMSILAATYFPGELPLEYRRRGRVSLPCSGWERVGHRRYDHQKAVGARFVTARTLKSNRRWSSVIG